MKVHYREGNRSACGLANRNLTPDVFAVTCTKCMSTWKFREDEMIASVEVDEEPASKFDSRSKAFTVSVVVYADGTYETEVSLSGPMVGLAADALVGSIDDALAAMRRTR